jgi:Tol biopolymer transport system component
MMTFTNYEAMDWMPDGHQFVFSGSASGQGVRTYIQGIDGGKPRPITPEGYRFWLRGKPVSPGGEWIVAEADGRPSLFPIEGGEEGEIPGVEPGDDFVAWSADGRSIFLNAASRVPASVYRVDIATGKRSLWNVIGPADTVGVLAVWSVQISADEQSYCYSYARNISGLYLVEGLQ